MSSKSIVPQTSEYVALVPASEGEPSLAQIVQINQGGKIDPSMLDRVKVPSGGALSWEVPTLTGEPDSVKELTGVIIGYKNTRVFFSKKYDGSNEPPDCASDDGITGVGDPGGSCEDCPLAKFTDGQRPRCASRRLVLLLLKDNSLPILLNLPPSSLWEMNKYFLRLSTMRKFFFQVETTFKLEKEKSGEGITYSKALPVFSRLLGPEEAQAAGAMAKSLGMALGSIKIADEMTEVPF